VVLPSTDVYQTSLPTLGTSLGWMRTVEGMFAKKCGTNLWNRSKFCWTIAEQL